MASSLLLLLLLLLLSHPHGPPGNGKLVDYLPDRQQTILFIIRTVLQCMAA